jgi:hypothetical protein
VLRTLKIGCLNPNEGVHHRKVTFQRVSEGEMYSRTPRARGF